MRLIAPLLCAMALAAGESDYQQFDANPMLGVNMTPPSAQAQANNGINPDVGVEAQAVYPGTAAANMGIQQGDVITGINNNQITSMTDLRNEVSLIGVGGNATVEVLRNGQKLTLSDNLGSWPANIPREPIDEAAERRFRDWQSRRLDRTQQAVVSLRKQIENLERQGNAGDGDAAGARGAGAGTLNPVEAMQLPASQALAALPAFHLTVNLAQRGGDATPTMAGDRVAWDARVLIGAPAPNIY